MRLQRLAASLLIAALLAAVLLLAGCSKPEPVIAVVAAEPFEPEIPDECRSPDPAWQDVPDADVTRSAGARNLQANKLNYRALLGRRAVCRAALDKQFPKTKEPRS